MKHSSIHVLLAMVTKFDLELEWLDVKTTFLDSELEDIIYIHQPEGFIVPCKEYHVYLLKKSLYSLKKSTMQLSRTRLGQAKLDAWTNDYNTTGCEPIKTTRPQNLAQTRGK